MTQKTQLSDLKLHKDFSTLNVNLGALDASRASQCKQDIMSALESIEAKNLAEELESNAELFEFFANALSLSGYLHSLATIHPNEFAQLLSNGLEATIEGAIETARQSWQSAETEADLMSQLRAQKRIISLSLAIADLGGWLLPERITHHLSEFAGSATSSATDFLLSEFQTQEKVTLHDVKNPSDGSGIIILGMGKLGAHELNYSSDIDIIIFFDMQSKMQIDTDDPTTLFVRFAKRLSKILQERTGDGYVFRVDLRLRPDPGSTPLALPVETAFNYYEAYGQNWERAAFIKARPIAGDLDSGESFLKELAPFIWRKYLDFAAIADVHSIKRQIHAHKGHGEIAVNGHNVKLGRGGIREIEFFVQTQQLIAGGRNPDLRNIGTISALNALAKEGWITEQVSTSLTKCYWHLRKVEHRIQMVADEQTHLLPHDDKELTRIALMMGDKDSKTFSTKLIEVMQHVETYYAELFEASPELTGKSGNLVFTGDDDDPGTLETLSKLGFKQPSQIISTIRGWHFGRLKVVSNAQARELLTELTPLLLEAFAEADEPDTSFFAFERFLSGLPAGVQLFSVLKTNPKLHYLLTSILSSSPRLSEIITRRPNVFDGLIDPSFGPNAPDQQYFLDELGAILSQAKGYEDCLDQVRIFNAEQKFLISIRFLNRTISAQQTGVAFADLAEAVLQHLLILVQDEFEKKHGVIEGGEIAVLGMGRLGSNELSAGSDLDLIFLYRHDASQEISNGEKALYASQYYMRLVQRLITATSAHTAQGVAYELDFRLRPSGNSGPLATDFDTFINYQKNDAWVWEQQAMVRARVVCGHEALTHDIGDALKKLLSEKRDRKQTSKEIVKMRKLLEKEKPAKNAFDVKGAKGGFIDIEFIVQWAVLVSGEDTKSFNSTSTIDILENLPVKLIDNDAKQTLKAAFELYSTVMQFLRINLPSETDPKDYSRELNTKLAYQTGQPDLATLSVTLKDMQSEVREIFKALLGA